MERFTLRLREFLRLEAASGVALLAISLVALAWANSPLSESYFALWHVPVLGLTIHHWINDGLMAIFFLVVGLEIKRELLSGELSSPKKAALPIAAAIGGMLVPAVIYSSFNYGTEWARGWGIPMATDIAFAIGALGLLGKRVPLSLKVFLTALAIVDDMGAVLVIALFYTAQIAWANLGAGAAGLALLLIVSRLRMTRPAIYLLAGAIVWIAFFRSGVHATIAGVLLAFVIPSQTGDRIEHALHPWVSFGIMPIFALANAGVPFQGGSFFHPVSLGIGAGLVFGKVVGISIFSWLAVRLGLAVLPERSSWPQIFGIGCLGGIGFTMSLFIASLAFEGTPVIEIAKLGILASSTISGVAGSLLLLGAKTRTRSLLPDPKRRGA